MSWRHVSCSSVDGRRSAASCWESQQSAECHVLKKRWRHHISFHRDTHLFIWITTEKLLALTLRRKSGSISFSLFPFCPFLVPVVVIHVKSHDAAELVHMTTITWCEVFQWFGQLERDVSAGQVVLMWDLFLRVMNMSRKWICFYIFPHAQT